MGSLSRWMGGLLVLALVAAGALLWVYERFTAPGLLPAAAAIVILKGRGVDGIAGRLAESGVIDSPYFFATAVRLLGEGRRLRAGEFLFPAHASMRDAINVLIFARPVVRKLTIPEGLTTAQVVEEIGHTEGLDGRLEASPPEGSLLPETYNFSYGDSRADMLRRMRKAMSETLAALWRARAADLLLKTPQEALTLASIVEKETGKADERPHIAAIFLNRLRLNMRLQSDPTVVYGLTHGKGPLGRALTHADLELASPYNSYLNDGLPPGPIANPGRAALLAVLHPAASEDLYFVADGSGGHAFAKTLAEHNRNVARLRQLQAAPAQ